MTHDYTCPDCGFVSSGHATKKAAAERGREHQSEHASCCPEGVHRRESTTTERGE